MRHRRHRHRAPCAPRTRSPPDPARVGTVRCRPDIVQWRRRRTAGRTQRGSARRQPQRGSRGTQRRRATAPVPQDGPAPRAQGARPRRARPPPEPGGRAPAQQRPAPVAPNAPSNLQGLVGEVVGCLGVAVQSLQHGPWGKVFRKEVGKNEAVCLDGKLRCSRHPPDPPKEPDPAEDLVGKSHGDTGAGFGHPVQRPADVGLRHVRLSPLQSDPGEPGRRNASSHRIVDLVARRHHPRQNSADSSRSPLRAWPSGPAPASTSWPPPVTGGGRGGVDLIEQPSSLPVFVLPDPRPSKQPEGLDPAPFVARLGGRFHAALEHGPPTSRVADGEQRPDGGVGAPGAPRRRRLHRSASPPAQPGTYK